MNMKTDLKMIGCWWLLWAIIIVVGFACFVGNMPEVYAAISAYAGF